MQAVNRRADMSNYIDIKNLSKRQEAHWAKLFAGKRFEALRDVSCSPLSSESKEIESHWLKHCFATLYFLYYKSDGNVANFLPCPTYYYVELARAFQPIRCLEKSQLEFPRIRHDISELSPIGRAYQQKPNQLKQWRHGFTYLGDLGECSGLIGWYYGGFQQLDTFRQCHDLPVSSRLGWQ